MEYAAQWLLLSLLQQPGNGSERWLAGREEHGWARAHKEGAAPVGTVCAVISCDCAFMGLVVYAVKAVTLQTYTLQRNAASLFVRSAPIDHAQHGVVRQG